MHFKAGQPRIARDHGCWVAASPHPPPRSIGRELARAGAGSSVTRNGIGSANKEKRGWPLCPIKPSNNYGLRLSLKPTPAPEPTKGAGVFGSRCTGRGRTANSTSTLRFHEVTGSPSVFWPVCGGKCFRGSRVPSGSNTVMLVIECTLGEMKSPHTEASARRSSESV